MAVDLRSLNLSLWIDRMTLYRLLKVECYNDTANLAVSKLIDNYIMINQFKSILLIQTEWWGRFTGRVRFAKQDVRNWRLVRIPFASNSVICQLFPCWSLLNHRLSSSVSYKRRNSQESLNTLETTVEPCNLEHAAMRCLAHARRGKTRRSLMSVR